MARSFLHKLFLGLFAALLAASCGEQAEEQAAEDDIFCENFDTAYLEEREYQTLEDLPLFMLMSLQHVVFRREGGELGMHDQCLYYAADIIDPDAGTSERIFAFKSRQMAGEYPVLYEFRREAQIEGPGFITLSAFQVAQDYAAEVGMVAPGIAIYHLEYYGDERTTIYRVFAGDPPMGDLVTLAANIWFGEEEYIFSVEGVEDATVTFSEKYLEEE